MSYYKRHSDPGGLQECADMVLQTLRPIRDQFDGLYATGLSGVLPAAIAAYKLKKPLVILRKPNDGSHGRELEGLGLVPGPRLIIVDDFLCMGRTLDRLLTAIPSTYTIEQAVLYDQGPELIGDGQRSRIRKTRRKRLYTVLSTRPAPTVVLDLRPVAPVK